MENAPYNNNIFQVKIYDAHRDKWLWVDDFYESLKRVNIDELWMVDYYERYKIEHGLNGYDDESGAISYGVNYFRYNFMTKKECLCKSTEQTIENTVNVIVRNGQKFTIYKNTVFENKDSRCLIKGMKKLLPGDLHLGNINAVSSFIDRLIEIGEKCGVNKICIDNVNRMRNDITDMNEIIGLEIIYPCACVGLGFFDLLHWEEDFTKSKLEIDDCEKYYAVWKDKLQKHFEKHKIISKRESLDELLVKAVDSGDVFDMLPSDVQIGNKEVIEMRLGG